MNNKIELFLNFRKILIASIPKFLQIPPLFWPIYMSLGIANIFEIYTKEYPLDTSLLQLKLVATIFVAEFLYSFILLIVYIKPEKIN